MKHPRELAKIHTTPALETILEIMGSDEATPSVRLSAARQILNRGWGKDDKTQKTDKEFSQFIDSITGSEEKVPEEDQNMEK